MYIILYIYMYYERIKKATDDRRPRNSSILDDKIYDRHLGFSVLNRSGGKKNENDKTHYRTCDSFVSLIQHTHIYIRLVR